MFNAKQQVSLTCLTHVLRDVDALSVRQASYHWGPCGWCHWGVQGVNIITQMDGFFYPVCQSIVDIFIMWNNLNIDIICFKNVNEYLLWKYVITHLFHNLGNSKTIYLCHRESLNTQVFQDVTGI